MIASENIKANVGSVDGLEYQTNGTERLKGSYPQLITTSVQIVSHLANDAAPLVERIGRDKVSRISSRYFVTDSGLEGTDEIDRIEVGHLPAHIEARINLGKIFSEQGIDENIWWVWVGANDPGRITGDVIKERFHTEATADRVLKVPTTLNLGERYKIERLGTQTRLNQEDPHLAEFAIPSSVITDRDAEHIAALYKERIPIYVSANDDPNYISGTIAHSADTELFVLRDTETDEIVGCAANEYCSYPVDLGNGRKGNVVICESNDFVKKHGVPSTAFYAIAGTTWAAATRHGAHAIEAECVPAAYRIVREAGFSAAGLLERTSYMQTDGANIELHDDSTPEKFRKFNSLYLYTMTSQSSAWDRWKNLK